MLYVTEGLFFRPFFLAGLELLKKEKVEAMERLNYST
jgi:hypothetical protein